MLVLNFGEADISIVPPAQVPTADLLPDISWVQEHRTVAPAVRTVELTIEVDRTLLPRFVKHLSKFSR